MRLVGSVSVLRQQYRRSKDLRLCLALGTGEPGHGAEGQDEEETDQKTPPAHALSATIQEFVLIWKRLSTYPLAMLMLSMWTRRWSSRNCSPSRLPKGSSLHDADAKLPINHHNSLPTNIPLHFIFHRFANSSRFTRGFVP